MTNNYITLANSNNSLVKRFKAIEYSQPMERMDTIEFTLGGKTDKQAGPVLQQWKYTFRIPVDTAEGTQYGTWTDFTTFFALANANATPSDVITMTDYFGTSHYVYFAEGIVPQPMTTQLSGGNAYFLVPTTFLEKN